MTDNFSNFDLQPQLVRTVTDIGYTAPTPIQSTVIPAMLAGQDVIAFSGTAVKAEGWFADVLGADRYLFAAGKVRHLALRDRLADCLPVVWEEVRNDKDFCKQAA